MKRLYTSSRQRPEAPGTTEAVPTYLPAIQDSHGFVFLPICPYLDLFPAGRAMERK